MKQKQLVERRRRYRLARRVLLVMLGVVLILPLLPYGLSAAGIQIPNPGADLWREVRQREQPSNASTQVGGVDTSVLINTAGEDWRRFRMEKLVPIGAWVLAGIAAFIALFRIIRGKIPMEGGRSGRLVPRFSVNQRVVHWFAAIPFVILGLTGLVMLYGRFVLMPLLGPEGFSVTAAASKEIHNLFGPIFPLSIILLLILFLRGNSINRIDVKWFMRAGGLLKGMPASSGYYNGGQKSWFWFVVLFGLTISLSGLVLDFPIFGQDRQLMGWAHLVHSIIGVLFIAASLGHIYIGTIGMEGAFESMTHGFVDANWAKEHHDLWYQEMEAVGMVDVEPNALEEVKRHDDVDFRGFGAAGGKVEKG